VLFGIVWEVGGYRGVRVMQVLLATGLVLLVLRGSTRVARSASTAYLATGLVTLALTPYFSARPQLISLLLVAALAPTIPQVLAGALPRRLWACVPICWLWANLHGMWVLMPATLVLLGLIAWIVDRTRVTMASRLILVGVVCWVVTLVTPAGPRLAWWPVVVRRAASSIDEWQPTVLASGFSVLFAVIIAIIAISWARRETRTPTEVQLFVLAVAAFGLVAERNVAPAVLLLLPVLVDALNALMPSGPSFHRVVPLMSVGLGVLVASWLLVSEPSIPSRLPTRIASSLAAAPSDTRVLNDYNIGGFLTGMGGPHERVAIDGRTDMWPERFVTTYVDALAGRADWRPLVDELRPNAAVLRRDSEVARGLIEERDWKVTMTESHWMLLEPAR
jgi:hypothetical protein